MTAETAMIICAIIVAIQTVLVAFLEKGARKDRKKAEDDRQKTWARAERRERESRLSMELMSANCELSVVTAVALREGHTNGTLEPALKKAEQAQNDYKNFLMDTAARDVAKV